MEDWDQVFERPKSNSFKKLYTSYLDENKEIISFTDPGPYGISSTPLQEGKNHVVNVIF